VERFPAMLTKTEFFKASYSVSTGKVSPRNFSSLTFRLSGKIAVFKTGLSLVSVPGSLTFMPAGYEYETTVLEDGEMLIMHYTIVPGSPDLSDRPMTVIPQHPGEFLNLFTRGVRRFQSGSHGYDLLADSYRLLAEAERSFFPAEPPYRKLQLLREYMDENLYTSVIRVSDLAQRFGSSEVYFRREFKKYYGVSPVEYIKKRRLELA